MNSKTFFYTYLTFFILHTCPLGAQNLSNDQAEYSLKIPDKFLNYETILNEETAELTRLVKYVRQFKSQASDTNYFMSNLNSLMGISSRYLSKLSEYKDSILDTIKDFNRLNVSSIEHLHREIEKMEIVVNDIRDSANGSTAEGIMKYFLQTKSLEDRIDSLINSNSKKELVIKETIPKLNEAILKEKKYGDSLIDSIKVLNAKLGEHKRRTISWGLSITGFMDNTGNYKYEVQSDSTVLERHSSDFGGMLSIVLITTVKHWQNCDIYVVVNMPFAEYTSATQSVNHTFNQRLPLGFGLGYKSGEMPIIITAMVNFASSERLSATKRNSSDFVKESPGDFVKLDDYNASVEPVNKVFFNLGIVVPLNGFPRAKKKEGKVKKDRL